MSAEGPVSVTGGIPDHPGEHILTRDGFSHPGTPKGAEASAGTPHSIQPSPVAALAALVSSPLNEVNSDPFSPRNTFSDPPHTRRGGIPVTGNISTIGPGPIVSGPSFLSQQRSHPYSMQHRPGMPMGPGGPGMPMGPGGPMGPSRPIGPHGPMGPNGPMDPNAPMGLNGPVPMGPGGPMGPEGVMMSNIMGQNGPMRLNIPMSMNQNGPVGPSGQMGPNGPMGMNGPMVPGGPMMPQSVVTSMAPGSGPQGNGKIYPPNQPMVFNPANPNAPPIYPCGLCHKEVHDNDEAILCESGCHFWFHKSCTGLSDPAYHMLKSEIYAEWVCDKCPQVKNIPLIKMKP